jgi:hypothetical protein
MGLGVAIANESGSTDTELAAASVVEVHERLGEPATFRLRYDMDVFDGDFPVLVDERLGPGTVLSILVPVNGKTHCLVRGVVHAQQVHFEHGGAGSWVEVQGADRLVEMDRESKSVAWDGTASGAVTSILTDYSFTPDVETTNPSYSDQTHQLVQRDSDLRFVRRLARRHGFHLWVTSDDKGVETAHFKPLPVGESASTELAVNVAPPSLGSLDLSWDVERPTSVEALQLDFAALSDISGAAQIPLASLGSEALASIASDTRSLFIAAPVDDSADLVGRGEGALADANFFVRANCKTSIAQLGAVVRAHTVVNVRGLGSRHSGKYLVSSVIHTIDPTAHRMDVELLRNGWGS